MVVVLDALEPEQVELYRAFQRSQRREDLRSFEDEALTEMVGERCEPALVRRVYDSELGTIDLIPGVGSLCCVCTSNGRFGRVSGTTQTALARYGQGAIHGRGAAVTLTGVLSTRVCELRVVDAAGRVIVVAVNDDDAYWVTVQNVVKTIASMTNGTERVRWLVDRPSSPTRDLAVILDRLTSPTRQVLEVAQEDARGMGFSHVGSEHLLLGLLNKSEGTAAEALRAAGIDEQRARAEMLIHVQPGERRHQGDIQFTPRAVQVLDAAHSAAEHDGHGSIEPEHVLRGLALVDEGLGIEIIRDLGVTSKQLVDALNAQT